MENNTLQSCYFDLFIHRLLICLQFLFFAKKKNITENTNSILFFFSEKGKYIQEDIVFGLTELLDLSVGPLKNSSTADRLRNIDIDYITICS